MSTAKKLELLSVEDYLAGELISPIKHEYLAGIVYAMAGASKRHNRIAGNIFAKLDLRLEDKPCQPCNTDTKVRIRSRKRTRFYYTDAMVVCDSNADDESYQDNPVVIFEVLSRRTRRIDEGEKKDAYLTIPSLKVYVLVEQEIARVVAHRRSLSGFLAEVFEGLDATLPLPELGIELPLAEIYRGVSFHPEPDETDAET
jgi:Uma2 family endonuclease